MTQSEHTKPLGPGGFRQYAVGDRTVQIFSVGTGHVHVAVRVDDAPTEYSHSHADEDSALRDYAGLIERLEAEIPRAAVILFKPSGKYYTEETWRIPETVADQSPARGKFIRSAIGPYDMDQSPDFRRIDNGPVLVVTQEPWGYPHLFPAVHDA